MTDLLLPRVAAGDPGAVDLCLRRYGGVVWSLARRFCASPQDAEDAVQEIFVEVWRSAARFDPDRGSETTFVATLARRRLIDRMRKSGRRPQAESLDDRDEPPATAVGGCEAEMADELNRIEAAMAKLRPQQRRVLEMSLVEGRTQQEIAAAVGIPLGTVKSHARRGLQRVRALLGLDPAGGEPAPES